MPAGDDPTSHGDLSTWSADHRPELTAFARRRVGDAQAEEVVQEVFIAAAERLETEAPPEHPRAWLFAMLRNKCIDVIRRQSTEAAVKKELERGGVPGFKGGVFASKPAEWSADPSAILERKEFWDRFDSAVDAMPLKMRQAFVLRELDGASTDEVCRLLGITTSNLWVLIHRARAHLREALGPMWKT